MAPGGAPITAVVNVTTSLLLDLNDNWQCTAWRIATTPPGTLTDVDHANHNVAGTYAETFNITAPVAPGTYNAYFVAYSNNGCSSGASTTYTMTNAVVVNAPPTVSSINLASANPTSPGSAVSWTVTFSESVTGVDASDFQLVQGGAVSGASITSVTGSGATWTVTANTGSGGGTLGLNLVDNDTIVDALGLPLGGAGVGNGNFSGQVYTVAVPFSCAPPPGSPAGLSCQCDTFARASLNPSTIFGSNWIVSTSDSTGILPSIANSGYLRLTNNTGNNAKAATVPGIFPAAGNYISVEFQHFAYNGSGADGIAVTLSDYAVPPVPGAFGGSLGYAQKTGINGFAGGWLGVALDEYGNYQNATEGRIGGPGFIVQSVGMRGSGSGTAGYRWLGGTPSLSPVVDDRTSTTPSRGYFYQVIVDARNEPTSTAVAVNRDTTGTGTSYAALISIPNVYTAATAQGFTQDPVPANWQISFTGSTGGSTNIHEISKVRICASTVWPPSGGTASGFNAIDEAYGTPPAVAVQNYLSGHIYAKVMGTPFKFNVAALANNQIQTGYAAGIGNTKYVQLKLVDNGDGGCVLDSSQANYCKNDATCVGKAAVASQVLTFADADDGQKQSANFTLNTAWRNLAAVMRECTTSACSAFTATTPACSTDAFAVRPLTVSSVASSNATNGGTAGTPRFKAGSEDFDLTATVAGITGNANGYTGVLKINPNATQAAAPSVVTGAVAAPTFPAATSGTPTATATGTTFKYSEAGHFRFLGYDPATNTTAARGVFDGVMSATECAALTAVQCDALRTPTWTGVDSISSKGDCIANSFRNTRDLSGSFASNPNFGKFGCNFGLYDVIGACSPNSCAFGRFTPDHFDTVVSGGVPCPSWSYADAAARMAATGLVATDVGKIARQLDNNSFWELTAVTPTWALFPNGAYSSQPFSTQVTARNAAGAVTVNYDGGLGYAKAVTLSAWDALGSTTTQNPSAGTLADNAVLATAFASGVTATPAAPKYTLPNAYPSATPPPAPTAIYLRAEDADGVSSRQSAVPASSVEGGIKIASGRVAVPNAYGSELLTLPINNVAVQYYNGARWLTCTTDTTPLALADVAFSNCKINLANAAPPPDCKPVVAAGAVTLANGVGSITLNAPGAGNNGSADVALGWGGSKPWLPCAKGRATFGIYKSKFIYLREMY
ncbi:MAG: hypothetical protein PHX38_07910 [Sulfuricella sp.]|nr:hypothetical protein [Sulfuricella sp.]